MDKIIEWVKAHYHKFYNYFFNKKVVVQVAVKEPLKTKNLRGEIEELLESIDLKRYTRYVPSDGLWVDIEVPWGSIDVYIRKLRYVAHVVAKGRDLDKDWYPETITELSLDRFFLTVDGKYLDRTVAVSELREAGLSLCKALEPIDSDPFGPLSHYNRLLLRLMVNLKNLAKALNI